MSEKLEIGTPIRAEKGQGTRRLDCGRYEACLDHAAMNDWDGFDCASCAYASEKTVSSETDEAKTPAALCAECGERERMGSSPYCARCMAIRGNKARAKKKDGEKRGKRSDTKAQPKAEKALEEAATALRIEFGKHAFILREIESLADKEIRPVECQVIYMLKVQLDNSKEKRAEKAYT